MLADGERRHSPTGRVRRCVHRRPARTLTGRKANRRAVAIGPTMGCTVATGRTATEGRTGRKATGAKGRVMATRAGRRMRERRRPRRNRRRVCLRGRCRRPRYQAKIRTLRSHGSHPSTCLRYSRSHSNLTLGSLGCMPSPRMARISPFSQSGTAPMPSTPCSSMSSAIMFGLLSREITVLTNVRGAQPAGCGMVGSNGIHWPL